MQRVTQVDHQSRLTSFRTVQTRQAAHHNAEAGAAGRPLQCDCLGDLRPRPHALFPNLADQLLQGIVVALESGLQAVVEQAQTVVLGQQVLGGLVALQYLVLVVEDYRADL
ncbi:hypothetical protein D3C84_822410 [compost metagenome]